jgi:hypothetical protein
MTSGGADLFMATWSKLYPGGGGHMITGGAAAAVFLNMKMKNLFSKERFNNTVEAA